MDSHQSCESLPLRFAFQAIIGLSLALAGALTLAALGGVGYPYLLEWMEGGTVDVIDRILAGKPVYAEPTLDHVPYIYPPFYYWVSSGIALLLDDQLLAPRLVSVLSVAATVGAIFCITRDASASPGSRDRRDFYGILAIGLYLGCFEISGRWYHLARVDSLYVALLMVGFLLTRGRPGTWRALASGTAWALAFLTKQTAVVAVGPVLLSLVVIEPRRYLPAALAFGVIVSSSVLVLEIVSDGWFGYFVFDLPRQHALSLYVGTKEFGLHDLLGRTALATLAAILAGLTLPFVLPARDWIPFWCLAFGMVASSWLGRVHIGGYYNVSMPLYATVAVLAPLGLRQLLDWVTPGRPVPYVLVLAGAAVQLIALLHNPWASIPGPPDIARTEQLLDRLRAMPDDVLVFDMRSVQRAVGKSPYGLEMAARDVLRSHSPVRDRFYRTLQEDLSRKRFSAILLTPGCDYSGLEPALSLNYRQTGRLFPEDATHALRGELPNLVYLPISTEQN